MPRSADPERAAARRESITLAAAELFARNGFENTTAAEIARAAGMSPGSVFYHFGDKRAVFRAIFERDLPRTRELVEARLADADPIAALLAMAEQLAGEAQDPLAPGLLTELLRQVDKDPELARVVAENSAITQHGFATLITRGIATGAVDAELDPMETAAWIQTIIDGVFLHSDPDRDPRPMLRHTITKLLAPTAGRAHHDGGES